MIFHLAPVIWLKDMEEFKLKSWGEFRPLIQDIRKRFGAIQHELPDGSVYDCENNILFRGQSNADWELETTLERKSGERYDLLRYIIDATYPTNEIESFKGNRWNIPPSSELRESIKNRQDLMRVYLPPQCYEYLVYLRCSTGRNLRLSLLISRSATM